MSKFHLSVLQPIKGKAGKVMFTYEKHARNVTEAVEAVRAELAGSGMVVVQSQSLVKAKD